MSLKKLVVLSVALGTAAFFVTVIGSCKVVQVELFQQRRTVVVQNLTNETINLSFIESWDNTWHTAIAIKLDVSPGEIHDRVYSSGDSFYIRQITPPNSGFDREQKKAIEKVQDSITLHKESNLVILTDVETGMIVFEDQSITK